MTVDSLPRRLALVRHGEPDRSAQRLGGGLTAEGRRQALTAAGRLAYSRWSWIAMMPVDCCVETARTIAVEFPRVPMTECAGLLGGDFDEEDRARIGMSSSALESRAAGVVARLLQERSGDGIVVLDERSLGEVITELCTVEPPSLVHGSVIVLRQALQGWEILNRAAFGMVAIR